MVRICRVAILFSVFLALSNAAICQDGTRRLKGFAVRGTVVDFSGRAWAGAIVALKKKADSVIDPEPGNALETKTDSDGRFSFEELPEGQYEIFLKSVTPALREIKEVPILPPGSVFEVDFGLEIASIGECPRHFVVGQVRDQGNRPIAGAKVSVINAFNQRRVLSAKTDKNGFYQLGLCNPGQYVVFVNTAKYEVQTETAIFTPTLLSRTLNFSLVPSN